MKRIILMLTVAAMMVVAMTVPAAPAFAKLQGTTDQQCTGGNPNCQTTKTNGSGKIMTQGTCGGCATNKTFTKGNH